VFFLFYLVVTALVGDFSVLFGVFSVLFDVFPVLFGDLGLDFLFFPVFLFVFFVFWSFWFDLGDTLALCKSILVPLCFYSGFYDLS